MVMLCTSILSTESVLRSLPVERLKCDTLFVDVLSVKEFAKQLLLSVSSFESLETSIGEPVFTKTLRTRTFLAGFAV